MISAILLAAGQSKRMGGENKLAKEIQGVPLINHSIKNILDSSIDELIVVLGYQKEIIKKLIVNSEKIKFVFNKNFESGIASSIRTGLNHLSEKTEVFFICLGDMPMVKTAVYNKLISSKNNKEVIVPIYNGQQGNPILFSTTFKKKMMNLSGDLGAKNILIQNRKKIFNLPIDDQGIILDFDTQDSFNN